MESSINTSEIYRFDGESDKIFNERIDFIKKVFKDTNNLKESIRLSKVWVNFTYNKCKYDSNVYYKLRKYL